MLSGSNSMPLDYKIDWIENFSYEEDMIRLVKSLDYYDFDDNHVAK